MSDVKTAVGIAAEMYAMQRAARQLARDHATYLERCAEWMKLIRRAADRFCETELAAVTRVGQHAVEGGFPMGVLFAVAAYVESIEPLQDEAA